MKPGNTTLRGALENARRRRQIYFHETNETAGKPEICVTGRMDVVDEIVQHYSRCTNALNSTLYGGRFRIIRDIEYNGVPVRVIKGIRHSSS